MATRLISSIHELTSPPSDATSRRNTPWSIEEATFASTEIGPPDERCRKSCFAFGPRRLDNRCFTVRLRHRRHLKFGSGYFKTTNSSTRGTSGAVTNALLRFARFSIFYGLFSKFPYV